MNSPPCSFVCYSNKIIWNLGLNFSSYSQRSILLTSAKVEASSISSDWIKKLDYTESFQNTGQNK